MPATDLEKLVLQLDANFSKMQRQLEKAQGVANKSAGRIEQRFKAMNKNIATSVNLGGLLKSFGAGFIGGLGVEQLAKAAATAIKSVADIGDQAQKLGLTNAEFQQMAAAAKFAGSDVETLAKGMKALGVNSSEAARGQGDFAAILKANGVSITTANGQLKSQAEILGIVADLVQNAASDQDALAIAVAALGKAGADLLLVLQGGAEGVARAMRFAAEESIQFTDRQIEKAQEFDDKIDLLIDKISVGLKGAFIDAAIGAESYATRAGAALERLGISTTAVTEAAKLAVKYNPLFASTTVALGALQGEGAVVSAKTIPIVRSAPGKSSLPGKSTKLPTKPASSEIQTAQAAARAEEQRRAAVLRVIEALNFESAQTKRTEREQFIQNELRQAGAKLTSEEAAQIRQLAAARYDQIAAEKTLSENKQIALENQRSAIDAAREENEAAMAALDGQKQAWMELAGLGVDALDAIVVGGEKASDVLAAMVKQLASAALQASLLGQGPLASLFGTSSSGGLFGSLIGGFFGGKSVGLYASGGFIPTGKMGIVGEGGGWKNAELVSGPAQVTPIPKLLTAANGNSRAVTVVNHFHGVAGDNTIRRIAEEATARGVRQYAEQEQTISVERNLRQR